MALYQLMKVYTDSSVGKCGKNGTNLKHLKRRLNKLDKGWIVEMTPKGKKVVAARGFSRDAMML